MSDDIFNSFFMYDCFLGGGGLMKRILFNVSEYDTISMCFSGKFPAAKSWPKLENMPIENGSFLTMRVKSERTIPIQLLLATMQF